MGCNLLCADALFTPANDDNIHAKASAKQLLFIMKSI